MKKLVELLRRLLIRLTENGQDLRKAGAEIGTNFHNYGYVDDGHLNLLTIGNNVTLAVGCRVLLHDASTKKALGYSKIGKVSIGNDVFIGSGAIVLPNTVIGNKVIIGAGAVVSRDIPDNSVAAGNPARIIGTYDDYMKKNRELMKDSYVGNKFWPEMNAAEQLQQKESMETGKWGFDI